MALKNTTLTDLVEVVGLEAMMTLSAKYGNSGNLYIPKSCEDGAMLQNLIGERAANALTEKWGSDHLAIPWMSHYENQKTKFEVCSLLEHGMKISEIARLRRMSQRRVQQIRAELLKSGLIAEMKTGQLFRKPIKKSPGKDLQDAWSGQNQKLNGQPSPPHYAG